MTADVSGMSIRIQADGPYIVSGSVPLVRVQIVVNDAGDSVGYRETYRYPLQETYVLCRCGRSEDAPFCDGSHVRVGFTDPGLGSEAHRYDEDVEAIRGDGLELLDANSFCIGARFCDRAGGVWGLTESSGQDPRYGEIATEEAMMCPSGRLVMIDAETGAAQEPDLEPSIALIEDPAGGASSAIWVRGGIPVYGADDVQLEIRNRVTLCRCGRSYNKPFCDASHYAIRYNDGHMRD